MFVLPMLGKPLRADRAELPEARTAPERGKEREDEDPGCQGDKNQDQHIGSSKLW